MYTVLTWFLAPFAFAVVLGRGLRERAYWQGLQQRFGFGAKIGNSPSIWLHAVSLGEMSAAAPLIRALRARHPAAPLVLTTATPAGRARASALFGEYADIRFLPYDTPGSVRRFLDRTRPGVCIIMETELWPNLLHACARRALPVVIASARLTAKSVARYRRAGNLFSGVLQNISIAAQSADDAARFVAVGAAANRVSVVGNVKFDLQLDARTAEQGRRLRQTFGGERFAWVAGSTHAGEDEAVLAAHTRLLSENRQALLLLAPRHRDRFEAVAALLGANGLHYRRRSEARGSEVENSAGAQADCQVLLVDSLGELAVMYAAADVAFVGGSLVPIGGHNLLEPAALGVPVLCGPFQANNKDIAAMLLGSGAAAEVQDGVDLGAALLRLSGDAAERKRMGAAGVRIVAANRGSVAALLAIIEPLWARAPAPHR